MRHIPWQNLSLGFLQTAFGIVLDLKDIEKNISNYFSKEIYSAS